MTVVHNDMHTHEQFLNLHVDLGLDYIFVCSFTFTFTMYVFYGSFGQFIPLLLAYVVLDLVS